MIKKACELTNKDIVFIPSKQECCQVVFTYSFCLGKVGIWFWDIPLPIILTEHQLVGVISKHD